MNLIGKQKEKGEGANAAGEAQKIHESGIQLTDEELEKAAGGASFWLFDEETRKPKH